MPYGDYILGSKIVQGDFSYVISPSTVTSSYIDFYIRIFSEKWSHVDIAFEYKSDENSSFNTDAAITSTDATFLNENKLYGLPACASGESSLIRWKYGDNNIDYGNNTIIRIRSLPRVRIFSEANSSYCSSTAYGQHLSDFNFSTTHKVIGLNDSGQYMAVDSTSFYILDSLNGSRRYTYSGLSNPVHAIQINSGRYIVVDRDNDRIIELSSTLTTLTKEINSGDLPLQNRPEFVDYDEENETLLVAGGLSNSVYEITWSNADYGTLMYTSTIVMDNPKCATYKRHDATTIAIADTDNNRIIKWEKDDDTYEVFNYYKLDSSGYSFTPIFAVLYKPFRCFLDDRGFVVVEEEGRKVFYDVENSSSSSSSSSSSGGHSSSSSSSSWEYSSSSSSSSGGYSSSSSSSSSGGYSSSSSSSSSGGYSSSSSSSSSSSGGYSSSSSSSSEEYSSSSSSSSSEEYSSSSSSSSSAEGIEGIGVWIIEDDFIVQ